MGKGNKDHTAGEDMPDLPQTPGTEKVKKKKSKKKAQDADTSVVEIKTSGCVQWDSKDETVKTCDHEDEQGLANGSNSCKKKKKKDKKQTEDTSTRNTSTASLEDCPESAAKDEGKKVKKKKKREAESPNLAGEDFSPSKKKLKMTHSAKLEEEHSDSMQNGSLLTDAGDIQSKKRKKDVGNKLVDTLGKQVDGKSKQQSPMQAVVNGNIDVNNSDDQDKKKKKKKKEKGNSDTGELAVKNNVSAGMMAVTDCMRTQGTDGDVCDETEGNTGTSGHKKKKKDKKRKQEDTDLPENTDSPAPEKKKKKKKHKKQLESEENSTTDNCGTNDPDMLKANEQGTDNVKHKKGKKKTKDREMVEDKLKDDTNVHPEVDQPEVKDKKKKHKTSKHGKDVPDSPSLEDGRPLEGGKENVREESTECERGEAHVDKKKKKKSKKGDKSGLTEMQESDKTELETSTKEEMPVKHKKNKKLDAETKQKTVTSSIAETSRVENVDGKSDRNDPQTNGSSAADSVRSAIGAEVMSPGTPQTACGQWNTTMFESNERQDKFLRLLGGKKKASPFSAAAAGKKGLFGSLKASPLSSAGVQSAMTYSQAQAMDKRLESDFERALAFRGQHGVGLGFEPDPAEGKKFHIDIHKTASKKFD